MPDRQFTIANVFGFDPSRHPGILDRLFDRMNLWRQSGVRAEIIVCCREESRMPHIEAPKGHGLHVLSGRNSLHASLQIPRTLRRLSFDAMYLRSDPFPAVIAAARKWPTVLELHGDIAAEKKLLSAPQRIMAGLAPWLIRSVNGIVFVDPSLANLPHLNLSNVPHTVITNGIVLPATDPAYAEPPASTVARPRCILSVGSPYAWQGVDKYLALAKQLPEFDFFVVGVTDVPSNAPSNVHVLAFQGLDALNDVLRTMDVGFGNLALERVGRRTPSPLKVREYLAKGLPCIIAHEDPDLPRAQGVLNLGYGFEVDQQSVTAVRSFVRHWKGRSVPRETMELVSARPKEQKRLAFVHTVLQNTALS
ncbi:hypothetical protein [Georgenia wangjunii]|uniref:hypothetical protein n=1 Tax=Georgenia wangjunii TaxID=3117730 RepID=UPI002F264231